MHKNGTAIMTGHTEMVGTWTGEHLLFCVPWREMLKTTSLSRNADEIYLISREISTEDKEDKTNFEVQVNDS